MKPFSKNCQSRLLFLFFFGGGGGGGRGKGGGGFPVALRYQFERVWGGGEWIPISA